MSVSNLSCWLQLATPKDDVNKNPRLFAHFPKGHNEEFIHVGREGAWSAGGSCLGEERYGCNRRSEIRDSVICFI
jgi:hypothetical protein